MRLYENALFALPTETFYYCPRVHTPAQRSTERFVSIIKKLHQIGPPFFRYAQELQCTATLTQYTTHCLEIVL